MDLNVSETVANVFFAVILPGDFAKGAQALLSALLPFTAGPPPFTAITAADASLPGPESLSRNDPHGTRRAVDKGSAAPCCAACGKLLTAADLTPKAPPHAGDRRVRNGSGGVHGGGSGGSEATAPRALLECAGCHRCFHGRCHQRWADQQQRTRQQQQQQAQQQRQPRGWWLWGRGRRREQGEAGAPLEPAEFASPAPAAAVARKGQDEEDEDWFHSAECWQVHRALQRLCRAGRTPCDPAACRPRPHLAPPGTRQSPDGAPGEPTTSCSRSSSRSPLRTAPAASAVANASSWVAPAGGASAAAAAAGYGDGDVDELAVRLYDCRNLGPATAAGMRRVHSVVRQHFGYALADFRDFDYAALLTKGPSAVSAAIVDVYGSDLAELYLVATSTAMQRRGYGTALVRHLERALGGAGVRQLLVSVDDDDADNQRLWRDKFGFRPLTASELGHLGRGFGAFGPSAVAGTVFLARRLGPPLGAAALGNAAAAERC